MSDRLAQLTQRLANTRLAARSGEIESILRGKEPLRAGMAVEVERSSAARKAPNGADYHVKIKASTETIARDGGIVPMRAWERGGLKNFSANPVILAYHSHRDPIGISVHTELDGGNMIQHWLFHEQSETSKMMKKLYEQGFMRAASVGFLVHEFKFVDELSEDELESLYKQYGKAALSDVYWIAEKAELLETSAVPVPADPNALQFSHAARNAEAHGIDVSDLLRRFRGEHMKNDENAGTPATPAQPTVTPAPEAERTAPTVEDQIKALADAVRALTEKVTELETRTAKPAEGNTASTPAGEKEGEGQRGESGEKVVTIEKLDGESDEAAIARYLEPMVRAKLGMPVPAKK